MDEKLQPLKPDSQAGKSLLAKLAISAFALIFSGLLYFNFSTPTGDELSQSERSKIFQNMKNISALPLESIAENDWEEALASIPLEEKEKKELVQAVHHPVKQKDKQTNNSKLELVLEEEKTHLVWINLWDFADQDGDVVKISSAGYNVQVNLLNAPTRIAIPVNFNRSISLTGLTDGGGGITLAVSSTSTHNLVIEPGTTFSLPVSY